MHVCFQVRVLFFAALLAIPTVVARGGEGERAIFEGVAYRVFRFEPSEVRLFWKAPDGSPIRQFSKLQEQLARDGKRLEFVMNAGIFEPDGTPSGLHVEEGREVLPLNLKDGRGNFFLKPNGVFCIVGKDALILEANEYARAGLRAWLALQSGPLLLRDGRVHPAFNKVSSSRLHRNGVGVDAKGRVVFAITEFADENRVNLYGFAEFFRSLGCRDALFLDGDISMAVWKPEGAIPSGNAFGAILGVTRPLEK